MKEFAIAGLIGILLSIFSLSVWAETVAIVNGTVIVGDGRVIENATVLFEDGVIKAVGTDVEVPEGAVIIDAGGRRVLPGFIDPYTTIGLVEVRAVSTTVDSDESTETATPQVLAADAINPDTSVIAVTRIAGITTVLVSPGDSNPINGWAAVINLDGRTIDELLLKDRVAQVFNFSQGAERRERYPSTRMGVFAFIRQTLYDARNYAARAEKKVEGEKGAGGNEENGRQQKVDLRYEALLPVLRGEVPVIAEARTIQEIRAALKVAEEFKLKIILLNPIHAYKMLDEIKSSGTPVLLGTAFASPADTEPYDQYYSLAATLYEAGIPFAFTTGSAHGVRNLQDHAAMSVTYGLPPGEAVKAMTSNPAKFLGIDDKVGTIEPGKLANLAIWSGCPLQIRSKVDKLFIRGKEIPLVSRQEMLRDRFIDVGTDK
jgi:imidazolonepropionase-like amidohydrolase